MGSSPGAGICPVTQAFGASDCEEASSYWCCLTVADYSLYCRELSMWRLWLAVGLVFATAAAAPQDLFEEIDSDDNINKNITNEIRIDSSEEEVTTLSTQAVLEVINIVNENTDEDPTTRQPSTVSDVHEQEEAGDEVTTLSSLEVTTFVKSLEALDIVNNDLVNLLVTKDYPDELYLPDQDPIDNTIDDTLGSDDIIDVITNFIAEQDPMLQLYLSICFIHPACYQLDSSSNILLPHSKSPVSPLSQELSRHLSARRTETARNMLVDVVMNVQRKIKVLMFKYIQEGVGARGVSVLATKTIIDSIKSIWQSLNDDLEYTKTSIQELFYILPLDTKEQVQAMVEIAEVVQRIPGKTEELLQEATQEGYQQYVRESSWDSWKRKNVK